MTLESNKNFGGIGAVLFFVGGLSYFVQPLFLLGFGLVGALLMLVSLNGFADYYKEKSIFNNGLYSFVALIAGTIVPFIGFAYLYFYTSTIKNFVAVLYPGFTGDWANLPNLTVNQNFNPSDLTPFVGPIFAVLVVLWVFVFVAGFFAWRSLKVVSSKSTVGLFSTGGLMLLVGALIPVFGLILMWIALLLLAIAFFQIKPQPEQPMATMTMTPPPTI